MRDLTVANKRLATQLTDDGVLNSMQRSRAMDYAEQHGVRLEESIIRLEILSELQLLKYVATRHRTQFVSTEKLRNARVDREALKLVKKSIARTHEVFPLILDRKNDKLVVATADPDNILAAEDLKLATHVAKIVFVVVRPRAIHAAIALGYERDKKPFAKLIQEVQAQATVELMRGEPKKQPKKRQRFVPRAKPRNTGIGDQGPPPSRPPPRKPSKPPPSSRRHPPVSSSEFALRHSESDAPPAPRAGAPVDPRLDGVNLRGEGTGRLEPAPRRAPYIQEDEQAETRAPDVVERDREQNLNLPPPSSAYEAVSGPLPKPYASRFANDKVHGTWAEQMRANQAAKQAGLARDEERREPRRGRSDTPMSRRDEPSATSPSLAFPHQDPAAARGQRTPDVQVVAAADATDFSQELARVPVQSPEARQGRPAPTQTQTSYGQENHAEGPPSSRDRHSLLPESRYGMSVATPRSQTPEPVSVGSIPEHQILASSPFTELLRLTANLLDNQRTNLAGHSAHVARLVASACQRINLSGPQTQAAVLAAFLHDIGKGAGGHLTALAVAQDEELRRSAEQLYMAPLQLMATVAWPQLTLDALGAMYECFDGTGLPKGLARNDIPLSARILAVADSLSDLTRNPDNIHGRAMAPREAIDVLREKANTVFDPHIIDLFASANQGEEILSDLGADRFRVLVVEPDPDQTMLLQLRFIDQGFDVHIARDKADALRALQAQQFHCVLCEVDLGGEDDGLELRAALRRQRPNMGWVFLTSRSSGKTARQAFDLDVDDFISKPLSADIVVAKVAQIIERRQEKLEKKGVSGSLAQMSLADVVQIMWHGRKTCALIVVSEGKRGEVHFADGSIVHAIFEGASGSEAFYRLLAIGDNGDFSVDPDFTPFERSIEISPDALLLEGMRLLDEGKFG